MSRFGLMVDRAISPDSIPVLVDLGPVDQKASRDCADRLIAAGIGRKNFSIEGFGRLLVRIPKQRGEEIVKRFRFKTGATYWQCTHHRAALSQHNRAESGK